ncbi:MAG: hypothetical protein H7Y27_07160 [Gemmatimonadaceae bacterium]|nr:hypothetical protein [Chitinophagaceae bacterium]
MTASLSQTAPPAGANVYLQALWFDAKGNWEEAHTLIQDIENKHAAWIHAYLHRKEGDQFNAKYWYNRASKPFPSDSLGNEWEALIDFFSTIS